MHKSNVLDQRINSHGFQTIRNGFFMEYTYSIRLFVSLLPIHKENAQIRLICSSIPFEQQFYTILARKKRKVIATQQSGKKLLCILNPFSIVASTSRVTKRYPFPHLFSSDKFISTYDGSIYSMYFCLLKFFLSFLFVVVLLFMLLSA